MSGVSSESVIKKDAPRWHYIYYALAGFDLVTVVATLILSITILNIYTSSVDENNAWATRAGHLSDLSLVLVRVNTPGNDVFESGDPQAEEQRLKQYHAEFGVLFKQIDEDIRSLDNKALSTLLLSNMRKVQEKEQAILKEARNIFQLYQNNEQNRAGMRMAIMDQHFASASTELADVNHAIRSQQFQMLASEIQKAEELGRYEYIIVGLIVLMLSCVVFYGQLLAKKMRENQRKISELIATNIGIVETAKDGIMTFDDHGRIEMFNPACESAFGIDEAHIIGRDVEQLLVKNDQQPVEHLKLDDIIELQNDQDIEIYGLKQDNSLVPLSLSIGCMLTNHQIKYVAVVKNISHHKRLESDLTTAKEVAESANLAKSRFSAKMSHEIRTPMNGILGMTNVVLDMELEDEARECLQVVKMSGDNLLVILNDILDFSKLEAGKVQAEAIQFNLPMIVDQIIGLMMPKAQEKKIELLLDFKAKNTDQLVGDPNRIRQVLLNLVGNAIKFTQVGSVVLTIDQPNTSESVFAFTVADTGLGLQEDQIHALFTEFTQADASTTRKHGGTGLGLTISKQLTELMGGSIGASNRSEGGLSLW